ncbi:MAG: SulP family inorganic anion transporter [Rhodospirillum sp.]|nr:SulP family inorganic anion transporter [Rhodospirillum sp.]MCF8487561.1 SulP family inorganic anion transporter [Rhodospirillum sp.]MCF8499044.1 SulP family inorganic anion transporter [Rhodospirillum sp.]
MDHIARGAPPDRASFIDLFTPKLITTLRENQGIAGLKADALAGLTVAIVALPLSMAIAIASGVGPERGLYTAIVGGALVSALGGSRFQIGGPAGAFIILVASTVQRQGVDGLILATFLSGLFLLAMGFLRFGTYIKFIPFPVTVGFTAGIAVIIFLSQVRDLLGLDLVEGGGGSDGLTARLVTLADGLPSIDPVTAVLAFGTIGLILFLRQLAPGWPGMLIAVTLGGGIAWGLGLPVETIGSRFGEIPAGLPAPRLPDLSMERILAILPDAGAFALLGAIESLLSAVVADGMTGRRHRSNCELVGQGVANMGSALFGGICVTGTIARTATNVRAGAWSPFAGVFHSLFLLVFLMVAAPLAAFIPLACLAGVLALVAWNMVERHAIAILMRTSWGDALVLSVTFLLTLFRDLTEGILAGFLLGTLLFVHRMSQSIQVSALQPFVAEDQADGAPADREAYEGGAADPSVVVYRISGALFFGAAANVSAILDRIADRRQAFVLDFTAVPFLDSTGANAIEGAARKAVRQGVRLYISGASPEIRAALAAHGVKPPLAHVTATVEEALSLEGDREG